MVMKKHVFPFSAIVGQQEFKLALLLNVIDSSIGGVLAIGDKGTGKTTLIRSLTQLLGAHEFPFVNLPIGASEDRVLGHVNLEKLINDKQQQVIPGLLAKANQGCLYVDEINLLNDYLMDALLDASASGGYYLEREGISTYLESKFCLIGSMNPEEGALRPQLKDRFGLSVTVTTNNNVEERLQIIRNRVQFDDDADQFIAQFKEQEKELLIKIQQAKLLVPTLTFEDTVYPYVANLVIAHKVEGHRADVLLIKTARAYAAYVQDSMVTIAHVQAIQNFVLAHRSNDNSQNTNSSENTPSQNQNNNSETSENTHGNTQETPQKANNDAIFSTLIPQNKITSKKGLQATKNGSLNTANTEQGGQYIGNGERTPDLKNTVSSYVTTDEFELKHKNELNKSQKHIVFVLDSSGSMQKDKVVAYAKGMINNYLEVEKTHKPLFSLISIAHGQSTTLVSKNRDAKVIVKALEALSTGGKTYVLPAFKQLKSLVNNAKIVTELVIITDGKFSSETSENALQEAVLGFKMYCKTITCKTVVDAERGVVKLALAKKFAEKINANYEPLIF